MQRNRIVIRFLALSSSSRYVQPDYIFFTVLVRYLVIISFTPFFPPNLGMGACKCRSTVLCPWTGRDVISPELPPNPMACRWRFLHSRAENFSHVLLFYRNELDKMGPAQFI